MNPDKTEYIVIGTSARQRVKVPAGPIDLGLGSKPTSIIRSQGELQSMTKCHSTYVDSVCKTSNFNLRALHHIQNFISENTAKTIARSMVDGRLGYCSSVLYSTPSTNINKLQ